MATWEVQEKTHTRYVRQSGQMLADDLFSLATHIAETHGGDARVSMIVPDGTPVLIVSGAARHVSILDTTDGELRSIDAPETETEPEPDRIRWTGGDGAR